MVLTTLQNQSLVTLSYEYFTTYTKSACYCLQSISKTLNMINLKHLSKYTKHYCVCKKLFNLVLIN